jgi:hypothetical protein
MNKNNKIEKFIMTFFILSLFFCAGALVGSFLTEYLNNKIFIEKGLKKYNETTGILEWINEEK